MKKDITQKTLNVENAKVVAPSVSTLNFMKQFARAYYSDKKVEEPLRDIILN